MSDGRGKWERTEQYREERRKFIKEYWETHEKPLGSTYIKAGYVFVKVGDHPLFPGKKKWVKRSRLVLSEKLGRILETDEIVHHKNGVRNDDRSENLELMTKEQHALHHDPEINLSLGRIKTAEFREAASELLKRRWRENREEMESYQRGATDEAAKRQRDG